MRNRKNNRIIKILLLLVLVGVGTYFISNKIDESQLASGNSFYKGQIEYIEGDVEKRTNNIGWELVEKGEIIENGDEVRALNESRTVITFEDGSILRLDENTSIRIESSKNKIAIILDKGTVFNNVSKSDKREYLVSSDDFQIIALGTEFLVEKEINSSTKVMVLESEVEVRDSNGDVIEKIETGKKLVINNKEVEKTDISTDDKKDDFIAWNISYNNDNEIIEEEEAIVVAEKEEVVVPVSKISIWGEKTSNGVRLNWSLNEVSAPKGFKLVKSASMNPVYPGNDYKYISNSGQRSYDWNITTGKGYYFRVCQYVGGKCGVYSKNLYLKTPTEENIGGNDSVKDINLSVDSTGDGYVNLSWNIDGYSPKGYKISYSKNINPEYPTRSGDTYKYLSNSNLRNYKLTGNFESGQKYYFRICEYLSGKCGVYSNNASHTFSGSTGGDEYATDLSLSVSNDGDYVTLNWSVASGNTPKGFKAVYSKDQNPVYPGNTYQYISNSGARSVSWPRSKFNDGETYHFRVCTYMGSSACGAYSNNVSVNF